MTIVDTDFWDDSSRPRLLIVEDDELIARLLSEALEEFYDVSCVHTVAGALGALVAGEVDAVLSDYHLLDGPAVSVLREAERRGVPALVMTGDRRVSAEVTRRGWPLLAKPFGVAELQRGLGGILEAFVPPPARDRGVATGSYERV